MPGIPTAVAYAIMLPIIVAAMIWLYIANPHKLDPQYLASSFDFIMAICLNPSSPFVVLFVFRYLKIVVHLFSFWFLYKATPLPTEPKYTRHDCTVILPTIDPGNPDFAECVESCLRNTPAHLFIATVGTRKYVHCQQAVALLRQSYPSTQIRVLDCPVANKRQQIAFALRYVSTDIVVLLDDHVFWPSLNFLPTALAPFEDNRVGAVGTNKRVRKAHTGFNLESFWNMMGAIYLERHNFEIRATNAIDGGVFVLSGRTALYRASILKSRRFLRKYTKEKFFFSKFGPLNTDDDNFITRWLVSHGHDIKIQYCNDALIETNLGVYPKFLSQCLRWVRTTWRSNSASIFTDRTVWSRQPWCIYAVHLTSFVNFVLFYDSALIYTLTLSPLYSTSALRLLCTWIFFTKMIKLTPYLLRNPKDLLMLPGYFIFAGFASLIKLYALFTFFNTNWCGRDLDETKNPASINADSNDDDDYNADDDETYEPGSSISWGSSECSSPVYSPRSGSSSSSSHHGGGGGYESAPSQHSADNQLPESIGPAIHKGKFDYRKLNFGKKPTLPSYGMRRAFDTPWGPVSPSNPHTKPANMLDGVQSNQANRERLATKWGLSVDQVCPCVEAWLEDTPVSVPSHSQSPDPRSPPATVQSFDGFWPNSPPESHLSFSGSEQETTTNQVNAFSLPETPRKTTASEFPPSPPQSVRNGPSTRLRSTPIYQRNWVRGAHCNKLHHDGCLFANDNACEVTEVFKLPAQIVPGRPRM